MPRLKAALVRRAFARRAEPERRKPEARSLSQKKFPILGTGTPVVGSLTLPFKMKKLMRSVHIETFLKVRIFEHQSQEQTIRSV